MFDTIRPEGAESGADQGDTGMLFSHIQGEGRQLIPSLQKNVGTSRQVLEPKRLLAPTFNCRILLGMFLNLFESQYLLWYIADVPEFVLSVSSVDRYQGLQDRYPGCNFHRSTCLRGLLEGTQLGPKQRGGESLEK